MQYIGCGFHCQAFLTLFLGRQVEKVQEFKIFEDFLKRRNMHFTQPRKTILRIFLQDVGHIEMGELYEKVKKADRLIGMSTLYRTMNLLVACGLVRENVLTNNKRCFEKAYGKKHHDHLVCTQCKEVKEFHHPLIERFQEKIANRHQFSITSHRMTLFGICRNCK